MRKINEIILHCAYTPVTMDIGVSEIRDWHINERGWSDVGYHYIIRLDGTIELGRPIEKIGAHTKGRNRNSIGICYVGGKSSNCDCWLDTRTDEQRKSLESLVNALKMVFNRLSDERLRLDLIGKNIESQLIRKTHDFRQGLDAISGKLNALSPRNVLERGYCMAKKSDGVVVRNSADVRTGGRVHLTCRRGGAKTLVEEVYSE